MSISGSINCVVAFLECTPYIISKKKVYIKLASFPFQQDYILIYLVSNSRITLLVLELHAIFWVILKPHHSFLKPPSQFNFVEPLHTIYLLPEFWCTLFGSSNFTGADFNFPLFLKGFVEHPYCKAEMR